MMVLKLERIPAICGDPGWSIEAILSISYIIEVSFMAANSADHNTYTTVSYGEMVSFGVLIAVHYPSQTYICLHWWTVIALS